MNKIKVFEAFSGYGSQSIALRNLGIPHEVVAISEIDKYAIKAYEAIHEPTLNLGDISKIKVEDIPVHDLFTYSFPCQDLSVAGKQAGLGKGTRSGLLYECKKIIEHCRPKYLLLENVKNLVGKKFKPQFDEWLAYLESLGYTSYWKVLNAKDYGVPQNRERVFVVSILGDHKPYKFADKIPLDKCIADILEDEVDEKYYLSEDIQKRFKATNQNKNIIGTTKPEFRTIGQRDLVYNKEGIMGALIATDYKQPKQIAEIDKVERLGGVFDDEKGKHQAGSVYNKDKCSPTLDTMQGGYRQPLIIDNINVVGKLDCKGWHDIETRVYDTNGVSPTIETRNRGKYIDYKGKQIELPCIGASRGRNPENPSDRTAGAPTEQQLEFNTKGTSNTITTVQKDNYVVEPSFRIRKLTPRECFRLMGMKDDDIDKIQQAGISNTQQYKLSGNSIVVNVLEAIFKKLFLQGEYNEQIQRNI